MVIRLGQGYWVDASDGVNWTLMQDIADLVRLAVPDDPVQFGHIVALVDREGCR